jgi:hypothetical protein
MNEATAARGFAVEDGRHALISDLRLAWGLDLEHELPAMGAAPIPTEIADAEILEMIDAGYRAISCPGRVTVTIGDPMTVASGTIPARAGERPAIWLFVDNPSGSAVDVSATVPGDEGTASARTGSTASVLLRPEPLLAGQSKLHVAVSQRDSVTHHEIDVRVVDSWTLSTQIVDDLTGDPVAARVRVTDDIGSARPADSVVRRDEHGNEYFFADGGFEVQVHGSANITVARGTEYEPLERTIPPPSGGRSESEIRLRRWSDLASDRWYAGDVHVHLNISGDYLLSPDDADLAQRAEDVRFMNMMVSNLASDHLYDRGFFEGAPHPLSDDEHVLRWGEEFRTSLYGHVCLYGIGGLVDPFFAGFAASKNPFDVPLLAHVADECHEVGGTISYAHPLRGDLDIERIFGGGGPAFARGRGIEAKELPVDVALGKTDSLDLMSYTSDDLVTAELWYRLLNCGFRLPATAGTDTFMNIATATMFGGAICNPPAGNRVFAHVEGGLSTEAWCAAVRDGRTFVTNGPVLDLSVDGFGVGATLRAESGQAVRIEGSGRSWVPMDKLELVLNGQVIAEGEVLADGRTASLATSVEIASGGWVALRAVGGVNQNVFGGPLFAHTSPVYIEVGGALARDRAAAEYFVAWVDALIELCRTTGNYPSDAERDAAITLFGEARSRFAEIATH